MKSTPEDPISRRFDAASASANFTKWVPEFRFLGLGFGVERLWVRA
jgi:hypothetical protein